MATRTKSKSRSEGDGKAQSEAKAKKKPKARSEPEPIDDSAPLVRTIGHSTMPIETFIERLRDADVDLLVDVRTVPKSRHNPQFETNALAASLRAAGLEYKHMADLGGLRRTHSDSPNGAWRNASFRGYADYMQTPEFEAALDELIEMAGKHHVAIMCAEGAPFRCHRSLIADALLARGVQAAEVGTHGHLRAHRMTPFARVDHGQVSYPPEG